LDYLRLKVAYDRDNWRMQPLFITHEVLCRRHRTDDAVRWQEVISVYMRATAQQHLRELERLETEHSIKLRTIRERVEERFVASLGQDRLAAMLPPLWSAIRKGDPLTEERLKHFNQGITAFAGNPVGAGLDTPQWIRRLEREINNIRVQEAVPEPPKPPPPPLAAFRRQLAGDWETLDDLP